MIELVNLPSLAGLIVDNDLLLNLDLLYNRLHFKVNVLLDGGEVVLFHGFTDVLDMLIFFVLHINFYVVFI